MIDLLLPTTDAAVVAQAAFALIAVAVGLRLTRGEPDRRIFVWGIAILLAAGFGLRSMH